VSAKDQQRLQKLSKIPTPNEGLRTFSRNYTTGSDVAGIKGRPFTFPHVFLEQPLASHAHIRSAQRHLAHSHCSTQNRASHIITLTASLRSSIITFEGSVILVLWTPDKWTIQWNLFCIRFNKVERLVRLSPFSELSVSGSVFRSSIPHWGYITRISFNFISSVQYSPVDSIWHRASSRKYGIMESLM
jgi:hypothetical protein